MNQLWTIRHKVVTEYVEQRSRFVGVAVPVIDAEQCGCVLAELGREHPFATHICFAYRTGARTAELREKSSDAGEPRGSAGAPIAEVLARQGLSDVLVAVVRYFGGVKLGVGGLVRAYSHSATLTLDSAQRVRMQLLDIVEVVLSFGQAPLVRNLACGIEIERNYGQDVRIRLACQNRQRLEEELGGILRSAVTLRPLGREWVSD